VGRNGRGFPVKVMVDRKNVINTNKKESIERGIHQIRTYYALAGNLLFEEDY
jgi:hypothetical protein